MRPGPFNQRKCSVRKLTSNLFQQISHSSDAMATQDSSKPLAFSVYKNAPKDFKPKLLAEPNVYLQDIFSSEKVNPDKPMSSGIFRLEKGKELEYLYTYDEMKIILEGEFTISDETGQKTRAVPGDHFFFPNGSKITFSTEDYGLALYVGQRNKDYA